MHDISSRETAAPTGEYKAPMTRPTVEQIVAHRDKAIQLFETAFEAIQNADAAIKVAQNEWRLASPGYNNFHGSQAEEVKAFEKAVRMPDRNQYLRTARRLIDCDVWAYIIERTDLERLMDKEAKDKLRDQMRYIPERSRRDGELITGDEIEAGLPPLTVDNVMATIEMFVGDAGLIFRRGIANAFSKLDRRFRSHDGFKIGGRVVLSYFFNSFGSIYGNSRDTLIDVERVFAVLDGQPQADFRSALWALERDRRGRFNPRRSETETPYFRIKAYKNGNAHLWFTRDDLLEKVNKLLAEFYGEVVGDAQTREEDIFSHPTTLPAKRFGFYPTPPDAVRTLLKNVALLPRANEKRLRIMEPSAGTGNLARACVQTKEQLKEWSGGIAKWGNEYRFDNQVDCVEIQPHLAGALNAEGIYRKVYSCDFLSLTPNVTGFYDRIVMNPPFDRERDIDHVIHALKFLEPGGQLVAIMSAGTEFRTSRKSEAFRELIHSMGGTFSDLPAGSFAESGTYVNTIILSVTAPQK